MFIEKFIIFLALTIVNAGNTKMQSVAKKCDEIITESLQLIQLHNNLSTILNQTINCVANRYTLIDPSCYLLTTTSQNSNQIKYKCRNSSNRKKLFDLIQVLKEELFNLNKQLDGYEIVEGFVVDTKIVNELSTSCRVIDSSKTVIFTEFTRIVEEAQKCATYEIKKLCSIK